jgi:hypothetical protein
MNDFGGQTEHKLSKSIEKYVVLLNFHFSKMRGQSRPAKMSKQGDDRQRPGNFFKKKTV